MDEIDGWPIVGLCEVPAPPPTPVERLGPSLLDEHLAAYAEGREPDDWFWERFSDDPS